MSLITEHVKDVAGRPDNSPWTFRSPAAARPGDAGQIVTSRERPITPVDGYLSVELVPGPVEATYRGHTWRITVPETDANLWDLIDEGEEI